MKYLSLFTFSVLVIAVVWAVPEEYEEVDDDTITEVLGSERLMKNYIECMKGLGKCTNDGEKIKASLPEALNDGCTKCSEKLLKQGRRVLDFVLANYEADFKEIEKMYDPDQTYRTKYASDLAKEGVVLP